MAHLTLQLGAALVVPFAPPGRLTDRADRRALWRSAAWRHRALGEAARDAGDWFWPNRCPLSGAVLAGLTSGRTTRASAAESRL